MGTIVNVTAAPIQFASTRPTEISVAAGPVGEIALDVTKHLTHDPSCGAVSGSTAFVGWQPGDR